MLSLLVLVLGTPGASQADTSVWTNIGPEGGTVRPLAIDPATPATLYAGTYGRGVFKSTDAGTSWRAVNAGLGNVRVEALAIDPANPTTLYAGTFFAGMFKSTDGGGSWRAVGSFTDGAVITLAIDPTAPATVYAGYGSVFKSTDAGASWSLSNTGVTDTVFVLAMDPASPATLYAGTHNSGVFKSTDGGGSWSPDGLSNLTVNALAIDPTSPGTLYAGTWGGGVYKSTDGGGSWNATGATNPWVYAVAVGPVAPATVYAGTDAGAYKSTDGGSSWVLDNSGLGRFSVQGLAIDPATPATVYAATFYGGGVFKSTDGGGSWNAANSGLISTGVQALAIDSTPPTTLYAGTDNGVFRSTDGEGSWRAADAGFWRTFVLALVIDPSNAATLYAGTYYSGLFKSADGGANWSAINAGLPDGRNVSALVIDPTSASTLYAGLGGENGNPIALGIFKSTDSGASWNAVNTGLSDANVQALAIDPLTPATLYAGTSSGVFKSTDGGGNWSAVMTGLPQPRILALAIDPARPTTVYAGTAYDGVFKTTDEGGSWNAMNTGLLNLYVLALATGPTTPTTLYAGTYGGGVFKITDGSGVWSALNTGLTYPVAQALAVDPVTHTTLYAGTFAGGVFQIDQLCGNGVLDPGEQCDDGNLFGGDGCAANCTNETVRTFVLDPVRSSDTAQAAPFVFQMHLSGSQKLRTGAPSPDGTIPVAIRASDITYDPMVFPGVACVCQRAVPAPQFGPGIAAVGEIACGPTGLTDINYLLSQDHHLGEVGVNGFTAQDCTAAGGTVEPPGAPHPGVCNGPHITTFSGGAAPRGSAVIQTNVAAYSIFDGGTCSVDPSNPEKGPDGIPCTNDDPAFLQPSIGLSTTGTAAAAMFDANNVLGANIAAGETCGAAPCITQISGAPFDCDLMAAQPDAGLAGGALVAADLRLDPAGSGSDVVSTLTSAALPRCGNGILESGEQCDEGAANGTATSCCTVACQFAPNGAACDDGNACTQTDQCDAGGQCIGSSPMTCAPLDQCHLRGTCDAGTGQCSSPPAPSGTECNDGNPCTQTDACDGNGSCVGTEPVVCAPLDQCHLAGECDPTSGCSNPVAADGSTCNAGNACPQPDTCQLGTCIATQCVSAPITAGGTVTTDTQGHGATPTEPLQTAVTSPTDGTVAITETAATGTPPSGFTAVGEQVTISAPAATPDAPLVLVFQIDASRIPPGANQNTIQIFKDGTLVLACSGALGVASPDPCVSDRQLLTGGDVQITVLTSTASVWTFAVSSACPNGCDDGNPCTADFCDPVAGCGHTVSCQTNLVPGGGPSQTDCVQEWLTQPAPVVDRRGVRTRVLDCTDDDPACDFGAANGDKACTFHVALCLNVQDPHLGCTPSDVQTVQLTQPSAKTRDTVDVSNRVALETMLTQLGGRVQGVCLRPATHSGQFCVASSDCDSAPGRVDGMCSSLVKFPSLNALNSCTPFAKITVPLRQSARGSRAGTKVLQLIATPSGGRRSSDRDSLTLMCKPKR